MSFLSRIRSFLSGEQPRALRNRVGGLAFVKPYGHEYGADAIAGQIVTTTRLHSPGFWRVEPTPVYVATQSCIFGNGQTIYEGDRCEVLALSDDVLQPLRDPGYDERDESRAWLPPVPKLIPLKVKGWVS